jgi:hypothetical protein
VQAIEAQSCFQKGAALPNVSAFTQGEWHDGNGANGCHRHGYRGGFAADGMVRLSG